MFMSSTNEIEKFVKVMDEHWKGEFKVISGLLTTPGCSNDYGCCSKSIDLISLWEELKELIE